MVRAIVVTMILDQIVFIKIGRSSEILSLRVGIVGHTRRLERKVALPAIGSDGDVVAIDDTADKGTQIVEGDSLQDGQADLARRMLPLLHGDSHDRLAHHATSDDSPLPRSSHIRLVRLDEAPQAKPRPGLQVRTQLVQQQPGGPIAAQARIPLELQGRDGLLVAGHEENPEEPDLQGNPSLVEDGSGRQRGLVAASPALLEPSLRDRVALPMAAAWAHEAPRPTHAPQMLPAGLLVREHRLEVEQGCRSLHVLVLSHDFEDTLLPTRDRDGHNAELRAQAHLYLLTILRMWAVENISARLEESWW